MCSNGCVLYQVCWTLFIISPTSTKLKGRYSGFTLSVRLAVRPSVRLSVCTSVCRQNRVRSVSSTILARSISYLHILSSYFRRCVACKVFDKIPKCNFLANTSIMCYCSGHIFRRPLTPVADHVPPQLIFFFFLFHFFSLFFFYFKNDQATLSKLVEDPLREMVAFGGL